MLDALIVEVKAGAVGNQQSLLDSIIYILCYFEAFTIAVEKLLRLELKNLSDHQLLFRADSFTTRLVGIHLSLSLSLLFIFVLISTVYGYTGKYVLVQIGVPCCRDDYGRSCRT